MQKHTRLCLVLAVFLAATAAWADGGVTFTNIAEGGGAGIDYHKVAPPRKAEIFDIISQSPIVFLDFFNTIRPNSPLKADGAPGVAILDYDNDGDLDVYVANGPGAYNSLYQNQLVQTGQLSFVDVGASSGAGALNQDSTGVCFGDIDNDGDHDLYVVATGQENHLFQNQGDGTFADITVASGTIGKNRHATACSMADFNGDGLLDIVIANTYDDWNHAIPIYTPTGPNGIYPGLEHNILFINRGGNVFTDESNASGIENVSELSGEGLTGGAFTWAIAAADYDLDGDVDILSGDSQMAAGSPIGFLRLYNNDGTGHFTEVTHAAGLNITGAWMGLDFGDLNCDGHLDFFATDGGYASLSPSRWFLANGDGTFTDSEAGDLLMTPFGWGASIFDYDNDGDSDIVYHGGMDQLSLILQDNPGIIFQNTGACSANFDWDAAAVPKDHRGRDVQGVAVGDLNNDGFEDIVTVSSDDITVSVFTFPMTLFAGGTTGSVFDDVSLFERVWAGNINPGFMTYLDNGRVITPGTVTVEISSGDNGNGWAEITPRGSIGTLPTGEVNRDGIGAVVSFTPAGGKTSIRPIIGGSSYASQDALAANFGMGTAKVGTVDVLWPGGVHNRLIDVKPGERILFPEIPCDFATQHEDRAAYAQCVTGALDSLVAAGVISQQDRGRFIKGAFTCQPGPHTLCLGGGRFQAEVAWKNFEGQTGVGSLFTSGDQHGSFYFFNSEVLEFHVNLIDACEQRNRFWVFAAASTNVEYTLTVTDVQTQTVKTYTNQLGKSAPAITDTEAFATCP